jgi:HEPN domain-containing protein
MGKKLDYLFYAEDDYRYVKEVIKTGLVFNGICHNSQNICEKYLKHIIDINDLDDLEVMRTHSLKVLYKFIKNNIKDFKCNWDTILKVDGYYFQVKYPGDNSFTADEEDIKKSWDAVVETRNSVLNYLKTFKISNKEDIIKGIDDFIEQLRETSLKDALSKDFDSNIE